MTHFIRINFTLDINPITENTRHTYVLSMYRNNYPTMVYRTYKMVHVDQSRQNMESFYDFNFFFLDH